MTTTTITIDSDSNGFAEDKDSARQLRLDQIMPALDAGERVAIDFTGVTHATQSYVHALIGEALNKHGEGVLDRIEFRNCSTALRGVIELVVDYSLGGFPAAETNEKEGPKRRKAPASR